MILLPGEHFHKCSCGHIWKHDTFAKTRAAIIQSARVAIERQGTEKEKARQPQREFAILMADDEEPFNTFIINGLAKGIPEVFPIALIYADEGEAYPRAHDCPKCGEQVLTRFYPNGSRVERDLLQRENQMRLLALLQELENIALLEAFFSNIEVIRI